MSSSGWIHSVAFSPSGARLGFVSHDSAIALIDSNKSLKDAVQLKTKFLPFTCVKWVTENSLIAGVRCSVFSTTVCRYTCGSLPIFFF